MWQLALQARAERAEQRAAKGVEEVALLRHELTEAAVAMADLREASTPATSPSKAAAASAVVNKWQSSYMTRALKVSESALDEANAEKASMKAELDELRATHSQVRAATAALEAAVPAASPAASQRHERRHQ